jgi:hypothetical protein
MNTALASTINPYAGSHRISSSPREIEAARRATEISMRAMPYYHERYGERGRLFGDSDGAWLATLCRGGAGYMERQILWLGHVLASRGMPRWLLERHMEVLHAQLMDICPEDAACWALLREGAALLRNRHEARIPAATADRLAENFRDEADPAWVNRIPEMGHILVAAVADEADGIDNAVRSIEPWASDRSRFPEGWRTAVGRTIARARFQLQRGG